MNNAEVMIVLFAIVVVGYVAGKRGYMGGDFDRRLSSLVIDVTSPALILSSTMGGTLPDRRLILPLLGISLITYTLLAGVALFLPPLFTRKKEQWGTVGFALMFGNVGFIGYPIVDSMFGHEAVFYAAVLNVVNTFAVFTVGTMLLLRSDRKPGQPDTTTAETTRHDTGAATPAGRPHTRTEWLWLLASTPMLAAYIAMAIVAFGIDDIPTIVSQPLTLIGNITVPAALLIIGSSMSRLPLRTMMGSPIVYTTTLFRLVLLPMALLALFTLMGFDHLAVSINTVVIAMPVATYGTILCLKMGRDATLITELTFITTLLSIITIPALAQIIG